MICHQQAEDPQKLVVYFQSESEILITRGADDVNTVQKLKKPTFQLKEAGRKNMMLPSSVFCSMMDCVRTICPAETFCIFYPWIQMLILFTNSLTGTPDLIWVPCDPVTLIHKINHHTILLIYFPLCFSSVCKYFHEFKTNCRTMQLLVKSALQTESFSYRASTELLGVPHQLFWDTVHQSPHQ